jgi:hypothetical protein
VKFWETIFHFSNYSKITASEDNKLFIKLGNGKCAYSDTLILKKFNLKFKKNRFFYPQWTILSSLVIQTIIVDFKKKICLVTQSLMKREQCKA